MQIPRFATRMHFATTAMVRSLVNAKTATLETKQAAQVRMSIALNFRAQNEETNEMFDVVICSFFILTFSYSDDSLLFTQFFLCEMVV